MTPPFICRAYIFPLQTVRFHFPHHDPQPPKNRTLKTTTTLSFANATTMKNFPRLTTTALALLLGSTAAHAQFIGVNAAASSASIIFDDTNSFNPTAGTLTPSVNPTWGGLLHALPLTTSIPTNDQAEGQVIAPFTATTYDLLFPITTLTQDLTATGFADLNYLALAEFNTGLGGYGGGPTSFPTFIVSGTVQPLGFAHITGTIDYYTQVLGAVAVLVDTVTYSMAWTNTGSAPISFTNVSVPGSFSSGTIPALAGFENLILAANIQFRVDPATISVTSVSAPEPGSAVLALLAGLPLLLRRRRA